MKTRRIDPLLIFTIAGLCAFLLTWSGATWRWDRAIYDHWLPVKTTIAKGSEPIIIAIDERSLAELGRWPWPRRVHADLVERLTRANAAAVALDLLFAEPDPVNDAYLADAIARNGRVVLPVLAESGRLNAPLKETQSVPIIAAAAAKIGHVDMEADQDGIVRSTFLQAGLGTPTWPNFALAAARISRGSVANEHAAPPSRRGNAYRWVRDQAILIPYLGPPGYFPRVSYVDVLRGRVDDVEFAGRTVFVGATAAGLSDSLPTPTSGRSLPMSGVEVLANVYQSIVDQRTVVALSGVQASWIAALMAVLPLFIFVIPQPRARLLFGFAGLSAPIILSSILLTLPGFWWPPLGAMAGVIISSVLYAWRRAVASHAQLNEQRRHAAVTLSSIADAVITTDLHGRVQYMNPVAEHITGCLSAQAAGRPLTEVLPLVDSQRVIDSQRRMMDAIRDGNELAIDGRLELTTEDTPRGIDLSITPLLDQRGRHEGAVVALRDVTDARRLKLEIAHQASHDALTNLPNRYLLRDRLENALKRARRDEARIAVVFIDLDRFKVVNDSFGHGFGDKLLRAMASRLLSAGREQDTVARIGGDEFVMVLESLHSTVDAAQMVRRLHKTVSQPIKIDGQDLFVGASLGVSIFPRDGTSGDELLHNADAAMYRAKEAGRNSVQYFSDGMNRMAKRRAGLERALHRNLNASAGELDLHFQPIVNLSNGRISGTEALARWFSGEFGQVTPDEFISVAEDTGLIADLGEWALHEACRQARQWHDQGFNALRVAVNLSPRQLVRQDVPQIVREALAESGLAAQFLELEITENVMMQDVDANVETFTDLKALGVHLAVDDFGTGYSSLNFLQRFPVDRLKIDKSFVHDIGYSRESNAIVEAVMVMARSLELRIVAEGLETLPQVDFMRKRQCEEGQGYYLSRPAPAADITSLLSSGQQLLVVK